MKKLKLKKLLKLLRFTQHLKLLLLMRNRHRHHLRKLLPQLQNCQKTLLQLHLHRQPLLQLHKLLPECQPASKAISVVSELLDVRDVELAKVTNAQDFMHVLRFYTERWEQQR